MPPSGRTDLDPDRRDRRETRILRIAQIASSIATVITLAIAIDALDVNSRVARTTEANAKVTANLAREQLRQARLVLGTTATATIEGLPTSTPSITLNLLRGTWSNIPDGNTLWVAVHGLPQEPSLASLSNYYFTEVKLTSSSTWSTEPSNPVVLGTTSSGSTFRVSLYQCNDASSGLISRQLLNNSTRNQGFSALPPGCSYLTGGVVARTNS